MKRLLMAAAIIGMAGPTLAQSLSISLGIRETGSTAAIGEDGGTGGSLEWVNFDGQTLTLDGTWQQFSFDLNNDTLSAFTGDGILNGDAGTIEHIRIKSNGVAGPFKLFLDTITNDYRDVTGAPQSVVFGDFEDVGALGTESMFQEPAFSGSTSGNIAADPVTSSLVSDAMAFTGNQSTEINFAFADADPAKWVRLTTFSGALLPQGSPTISFVDSTVSFWMKGTAIPEPSSVALGILAIGAVGLVARKR